MLLTYSDIQSALNIDLTDPQGRNTVDSLISAVQGLFSSPGYLGFPIEESEVTTYVTPEYPRIWLYTSAPVTELEAAKANPQTNTHDTIDPTDYIHNGGSELYFLRGLPHGFHSLRLTYKTGWRSDTLPDDLRQAIIDVVGLKLQAVDNFSSTPSSSSSDGEGESTVTGGLKRVVAGSYTEEYSTAQEEAYWKAQQSKFSRSIGDEIPDDIKEVVRSYRPSFVI